MVRVGDSPPNPRAVADAFGLNGSVGELVPVSGAWSNRVYRLKVGDRSYAVKEIRNPWNIPHWREWLEQAWRFELDAIAAGVPAPDPIPAPDGRCVADVDRAGTGSCAVRVHRWVDGKPAPLGPVNEELASWAGSVLSAMHSLRVAPHDRSVFPTAASPVVADIAVLVAEAGDGLDEEVMTHGDVDQKNVLLVGDRPLLCDWDVAAPLVPRREVADVALSFGVWERFDISRAVIDAYRQAGGELDRLTPLDIAQPLMISVDWLVLNIERALRLRACSDEEASLGQTLVPGLLDRLQRSMAIARDIQALLTPA